jgi:hypothetical protein
MPDSHALDDKLGELFGIPSATHYDPLVSERHALYFAALEGRAAAADASRPRTPFTGALERVPPPERRALLDLLGVRAILSDARNPVVERALAALPALTARAECRVPTLRGPALGRIRENASALPRAFIVSELLRRAGPREAAESIASPSFDPARQAVVEVDALPAALAESSARGDAAELRARVSIVSAAPMRIEIDTESPRAALLVVSDSSFPGWRAEVNGDSAPIWPADLLFRGVPIPEGRARVILSYEPARFRIGLGLSALGFAVSLALLLRGEPQQSA